MNKLAAAVIVTIGTLLAPLSLISAQSEQGNPGNGQVIYEQHCLRCHGEALDGWGPEGRFLIVPPANFHSIESRSKTDWELLIQINDGVLFTPMHYWRGRLTDEQIRDVLAYIRMMAPVDATG